MINRPFNHLSLHLLIIVCVIAWLTLSFVGNLPEPVLISTHNATAEVVLVGKSPDTIKPGIGRYGVSVGPVGGSSSSGRVQLNDGSEYFVMFNGGRPEAGSSVDVVVATFDDGSRRVRIDLGY